ncbi:PREDICTED: PI-PLC X domain-containing protein 1 [Nicrophorus vespilloides]|uniref:PI-PLC X domain-containing protein 1 n=1 Tax=Nicrophorus vespilloides TaxID=110193 RepID=A0ABM1MCC9_NICVS|nr:PREDICTED: PI-PLC X domain-containing protein 1 [Nicrophorus vespilloides]
MDVITIGFLLICIYCTHGLPNPTIGIRKCGKVHLTISSLKDTYIEMNWITKCDKARDIKPDYIALYDYNPKDRHEPTPPKIVLNANDFNGFYRTKIKFGQPWLPGKWEYSENVTRADRGAHCFPFWIASLKGYDIIDCNCLSIRPTWMHDISDQIRDQRIGNLFIPGTHNSGSYLASNKILFENYIMNQDRSVWTQLVFGIRYIDLRIGYYIKEGFFINHDVVPISPLKPILRQIRKFIELAPREVVILDFHRFPYPSEPNLNIHLKLVNLIQEELGDLALPPGGLQAGKGPTMNEIWHQNKTLIICYGHREIAKAYSWLWNPLQQYWGDKRKTDELRSFIAGAIKSHQTIYNPMWAIMAELTPTPLDIIFRTNNLRKLADDVNKHITSWFRDEWAKESNIVATDFFLGNDIINVAIEANRLR